MLGRTVPEDSKKYGKVVCSAGYSSELKQFMRIYPIQPFNAIPKWSMCCIALRRNNLDSRLESWRLKDESVKLSGKANKDDEFQILKKLSSPSIKVLNSEKASLGIIMPEKISFNFDGMKIGEEYLQSLFPNETNEIKKPRIQFNDIDGLHNLQLRDWGSYEFLRKNPDESYKLWDALKLTDSNYEHLLFVGNHAQHRNVWLVIGIISSKKKQLNFLDAA